LRFSPVGTFCHRTRNTDTISWLAFSTQQTDFTAARS